MFSDELKKLRVEIGLTQQELFDLYEIPVRTTQDWESGKRVPPKYVQTFIKEQLKTINKGDINMKFNHLDDLKEELIKRGFQSYNLSTGLENFETWYRGCICEGNFETFKWLDENGKDIEINIAITSKEKLDDDEDVEEINYIYEI